MPIVQIGYTRNDKHFYKDIMFDIIGEFPSPPSYEEILHYYRDKNFPVDLFSDDILIPFSHPLHMIIGNMEYGIIEEISLELSLSPLVKNIEGTSWENFASFYDELPNIEWNVKKMEKSNFEDTWNEIICSLDMYNKIREMFHLSLFFPKDFRLILPLFLFNLIETSIGSYSPYHEKMIFFSPREEKLCHIIFPYEEKEELLNSSQIIFPVEFTKDEFPSFHVPEKYLENTSLYNIEYFEVKKEKCPRLI